MPELPEVETIRLGLQKHLVGYTITDVDVRLPRIVGGEVQKCIGGVVQQVRRYGKGLVIDLDNGYSMAVHVKMTGRLIYLEVPRVPHVFPKHTHAIFKLKNNLVISSDSEKSRTTDDLVQAGDGGSLTGVRDDNISAFLYYNDIRQFGWIKVLRTEDVKSLPFFKSLGLEPLRDLTQDSFIKILGKYQTPIKSLLMDQQKIAGIGNIYANDALFHAGIHPLRASSSLSPEEAMKLFTAMEEILRKSIAVGGASANNYVNALGEKGTYQEHFLVYAKMGEPCLRCNDPVKRIVTGGRSTFYCVICQV